jgi:hypothetical protein
MTRNQCNLVSPLHMPLSDHIFAQIARHRCMARVYRPLALSSLVWIMDIGQPQIKSGWNAFVFSEGGAVTVDWTVLAAAIVGLGVASVGAVRLGTDALGLSIQTSLTNAAVSTLNRVFNPTTPDLTQTGNIWERSWGFDTGRNYDLKGWTRTDGNGGMVQFVRNGYLDVQSLSGSSHFIDMTYESLRPTGLQNTLSLGQGERVTLSFNAADSSPSQQNGMDVYFGGVLVGSADPGSKQMQNYRFDLVGGSGDGSNTVELRARAQGESWVGLFVESIAVH